MGYDLPFCRPGQAIGLLGGSFDPPHAGHVHISHEALKRFGLDQIWWLVSPGNPLKMSGPAPLEKRMATCCRLISDPRIHVSDFETQARTRYTAETLRLLQSVRAGVRFVWLMGADNLAQLDQWRDWREIIHRVPLGVMARPEQRLQARLARAARIYGFARLSDENSRGLARLQPPAWCFVNIPMQSLSSTALRECEQWSSVNDWAAPSDR